MEAIWKDSEWLKSGVAGRKGSLTQMQDRSISAVTFTCLNFLSYPLPTQQAEGLLQSKPLKLSLPSGQSLLSFRWLACWVPFLLGFWLVLSPIQPHPPQSSHSICFFGPKCWVFNPFSAPTCSFLTPGLHSDS